MFYVTFCEKTSLTSCVTYIYWGQSKFCKQEKMNMHCPKCNSKKGIEIDMHSDGYAKDLLECNTCGTVWVERSSEIITVSRQAA